MSILPNPECIHEKHANCDGRGWDDDTDEYTHCPCQCHLAAAIIKGLQAKGYDVPDDAPIMFCNITEPTEEETTMGDLLTKGTKVKVTLFDCTDVCGAPHDATIVEVDPDDPALPYRVEYDDISDETWAGADEVTKA